MTEDGATVITIMTDEGPKQFDMTAGLIVVVPQGCWHQFQAPDGVTGYHPLFAKMIQDSLDAMQIDTAQTVLDMGCGTVESIMTDLLIDLSVYTWLTKAQRIQSLCIPPAIRQVLLVSHHKDAAL